MPHLPRLLTVSLIFMLFSLPVGAETLRVSYDEWCPYSCLDASGQAPRAEAPGYYAELLREIFVPAGYTVDYRIRPWERALAETRIGALDAVLSPARSEAPDLIFPEEEIGRLGWCFYTLADSDWTYSGPASLEGQTLGVLSGNNFGPEVTDYVAQHRHDTQRVQEVSGLHFLEQNIHKLLARRISVMLEEPSTMDFHLLQSDRQPDLRRAGCLESQPMYMAFSPEQPQAAVLAALFDQGVRALRQSGRLHQILRHYGLRDWREQDSHSAGKD